VRQKISLQQGIPVEKAKEIVRLVKDSKKKAQASIQGDTVRISKQGPRRVAIDYLPCSGQKRWGWSCSSPTTDQLENAEVRKNGT